MVLIQTMLNLFEILLKGKKWTNCSQPHISQSCLDHKDYYIYFFLFENSTGWQLKEGIDVII